jgi:hypothetical protein
MMKNFRTDGCLFVELWRPHQDKGLGPSDYVLDLVDHAWEPDVRLIAAREAWLLHHPGERIDMKLGFVKLEALAGRPDAFAVAPIDWARGRAANEILAGENPPRSLEQALRRFEATGVWTVPNIAAVHVLLTTVDDYLVLTRRSPNLSFHPGRWSASLEEGLDPSDVLSTAGIHSAATRGVMEELGLGETDVRADQFQLIGLVVERPEGNLSWVLTGCLPLPAQEVTERSLRAKGLGELSGIAVVPVDVDSMVDILQKGPREDSTATGRGSFHPTSRYRILRGLCQTPVGGSLIDQVDLPECRLL